VPSVGPGNGGPSCAPENVIDISALGFREGNQIRLRVDTRDRANDLHPVCVDRDSSEAVLRYTAPAANDDGTSTVAALRITTAADATQYDTVLAVANDCGPDYTDYSCNNDGVLQDGRETRKSTVYYLDLEPLQYVFIILDGYDGSAGLAEVIVEEIAQVGTPGNPCIDVPDSMALTPNANVAGFRCPSPGIQCAPGAASDGTDLCLPLLPLGAPCDPDEHRNVCEPEYLQGVLCAQDPVDRTEAMCALPGTASGALCRTAEPRCDGFLACSPGAGYGGRDICVPLRSVGAACDPAPVGFVDRCAPPLSCCGDAPDAGASFNCRPVGYSPCFLPAPVM
jgi:hypothetical protein